MKIRKVDDKPMVIHTKEKAKIHAHEPKGAKIKGSNIYTVERGPKTAGAKVTDTDRKKSYRKSTIHQSEPKNKGLSRFKQNLKESNTSIKTKNTNLHIAGRTGALVAGAVTDQVEGGQEVSQAAYLAYEAKIKKMDCIEYLSVQAPLEKVNMLEDKQSKYIHEFVKRKEYSIVGKMRRNGFSQRDVDRQWNQIVNMIRKKQISGVVVANMAAISSSVADAYFKVGLVIEAGGIVVTVDEGRLDMHIKKGA